MAAMNIHEPTSGPVALNLLQIGAVKFSIKKPFTWTSGWKSPIYCDNRLSLSYPDIRRSIKDGLIMAIREHFGEVQSIAGVATAGIPQGALVADVLHLPFLYVRSKPKEHGLENLIEGRVIKGHKVVIVEDLISTGKSCLQAAEALKKAGMKPIGVVSVFNYGLDIAANKFAAAKLPVVSLSDYASLLKAALEQNHINKEEMITLKAWRVDPEGWAK